MAFDGRPGHVRWRLVHRTPYGAGLVARGIGDHDDEVACHHSVALLAAGADVDVEVRRQSDGHWWRASAGSHPFAESPAT